uniref:Peptidase S1 domain-containing protein n=1 Tax=Timema tahoe TaxID=61484 RepID=A0A7R9IP41_9NEOP|nr:unnamed protein product [Timema tahoe]
MSDKCLDSESCPVSVMSDKYLDSESCPVSVMSDKCLDSESCPVSVMSDKCLDSESCPASVMSDKCLDSESCPVSVLSEKCLTDAKALNICWRFRNVQVDCIGKCCKQSYLHLFEGPFYKYQTSKIVNGQQASRGQFPHQAALYLDKRSFCGGSLISSEWVLTAAHCAQGVTSRERCCSSQTIFVRVPRPCWLKCRGLCSSAETATVRLGSQNLRVDEEGRKSYTSREFLVHEEYNDTTLSNDIALIKLPAAVPPSPFIFPVNLPSPSEVNMTFENCTALVSGWGRILDNSTGISDELNFVNLTILTNLECAESYVPGVVISSTICARGTEQRSTCRGDSGGPLVLNRATNYTQGERSTNYTQIGVVSFVARSGCASGAPSGYVRVTSFLDWLATNTGHPERSLPSKANKPSFRKRTSKFEKAVQKFASEREESRQDSTHM